MLKLSARAVGAAFFGTVSGLCSGICFGLGAWWPAGIALFAAFACLMWSGRAAMLINETLERFGVPPEGSYDTKKEILKKVSLSERSEGPRPSKPKGQGGERLN